ncbi:MAG: hypothetical protein ABW123_21145 [Cystobacter sp.]
MSKRLGTWVALTAVLTSQAGCYTTKVISQARPSGPEYSDRQWFTIGGLVPLSPPAGRECEDGLAAVESKLAGTDWLINVGLGLAGGIVGSLACGNGNVSPEEALFAKTTCSSAGATLVPFLFSSRTVSYSCAEGGGRGGGQDFMPRQGGYRAPPPPPQGNAPLPPPAP